MPHILPPHLRPLTAALVLAAGAPAALAQTYTWTRGAGLNGWNNPDNWDPQGPPTNGSNVVIGSGYPRIDCWEIFNLSLSSIDSRNALWMAPTHLSVSGAATFDGLLLNVETFTASTLTLPGSNAWLSGAITAGAFTVPGGATLTLSRGGSSGVPVLDGCTLVNQGQVTADNRIALVNNALVQNIGTWNTLGYSIGQGATPGRFLNIGGFYSTGGPTNSLRFDNWGLVRAESGLLTLNGGGQHDGGRFVADLDATITFYNGTATQHRVVGPTVFEGEGTIQVTGAAPMRIEPGAAVAARMSAAPTGSGLWVTSGTLNVTGGLTNSGRMRLSGRIESDDPATNPGLTIAAGGSLTIDTASFSTLAARLTNSGFVYQERSLLLDSGATIRNAADGFWELQASVSPRPGATGVGFENRGVIGTSEFGPGAATIGVPLTMIGGSRINFDVQSGSVTLGLAAVPHAVRDGTARVEFDLDTQLVLGSNATLRVEPTGRLELINHLGSLQVNSGATLQVDAGGAVHQNADTWLNGGRIVGEGLFENHGDFNWAGGEIALVHAPGLTNTAGVSITGPAQLNGHLLNQDTVVQTGSLTIGAAGLAVNEGTWFLDANTSVRPAGGGGGELVNAPGGMIVKSGGVSEAVISSSFNNLGIVMLNFQAGTLRISGPLTQLSGTTLTGGTWDIQRQTTLTTNGRLIHTIGPGASVHLAGAWPELQLRQLSGQLRVPQGERCQAQAPFRITEGGKCTLEGNGTLEIPGDVEIESILDEIDEVFVPSLPPPPPPGGNPRSTGYVAANVRNGGNASPGTRGQPGPLHIVANFDQLPTGVLNIDLAGTTPVQDHDLALITGAASLAGTLDVTVLSPFIPAAGQEFTILTAAAVSGQFGQVRATGLPAGLGVEPVYTPTSVLIRITSQCEADLTGDGLLTLADFVAFRNYYVAADMRADFDGSGALTLNDFITFRNAYVAGCP